MLRPLIAVALCLVVWTAPALADQKDARLDALFGQLHATDDLAVAGRIEARIWEIWLQSGSDTADLLMRRSLEAMSLGRYEECLMQLTDLVAIAPDFAEAWNKRATVLYLLGRDKESLADIDRTLALEPRHFGALSGLGLIYNRLGDDAKALDGFERALEVNPHIPMAKAEVKRLRKKVRGEKI